MRLLQLANFLRLFHFFMMHLFRVVNFLCLQDPPSNDQGRNEGQSTTRGQGGDDRNDNV